MQQRSEPVGVRRWCVGKCLRAEPVARGMEYLGHLCLTHQVEGGLGRCHLLALSPVETAPSNPCPSGTPPTAGKVFKLLPLFWVSVGPVEHAVLHKWLEFQPSQSVPNVPDVKLC